MQKINRILIGIVTYSGKEYCLDDFIISLTEIIADCVNNNIDFGVRFFDNSDGYDYSNKIRGRGFDVTKCGKFDDPRENICNSYNALRNYFLDHDYTHLLTLEQDVMPPKDVINKLLKQDKSVIGAWYHIGAGKHLRPVVCVGKSISITTNERSQYNIPNEVKTKFKFDFIDSEELNDPCIMQVYSMGLGCVLMTREILEKIKFTVRKNHDGSFSGFNDSQFYCDLHYLKIPVFIDTSLFCTHRSEDLRIY